MTRTGIILSFIVEIGKISDFVDISGGGEEELEDWILGQIFTDSFTSFFEKFEFLTDGEKAKGRQLLEAFDRDGEKKHTETLADMSVGDNPLLKELASVMLREDNQHRGVFDNTVSNAVFKAILNKSKSTVRKAEAIVVCSECIHCDYDRGECSQDRWWDISKVDLDLPRSCSGHKEKK